MQYAIFFSLIRSILLTLNLVNDIILLNNKFGVLIMKKVLITGGSRGIGEECVRCFSKKGYEVFFLYKKNDEKAAILEGETGAKAIKFDVSNSENMEILNKIGSIDILVNNAGISQIKMFQDITEEDWDNMFNSNIKSMFLITKHFIKDMINRKYGRIINVASMWGETGASCEVHYSASKAAVIGFTKALAKELGPSGITVNCISPGFIETDMNSHLEKEDIEEICNETPLRRAGSVCDIAKAIMYIAENGDFITGQVIGVNGGIVI